MRRLALLHILQITSMPGLISKKKCWNRQKKKCLVLVKTNKKSEKYQPVWIINNTEYIIIIVITDCDKHSIHFGNLTEQDLYPVSPSFLPEYWILRPLHYIMHRLATVVKSVVWYQFVLSNKWLTSRERHVVPTLNIMCYYFSEISEMLCLTWYYSSFTGIA